MAGVKWIIVFLLHFSQTFVINNWNFLLTWKIPCENHQKMWQMFGKKWNKKKPWINLRSFNSFLALTFGHKTRISETRSITICCPNIIIFWNLVEKFLIVLFWLLLKKNLSYLCQLWILSVMAFKRTKILDFFSSFAAPPPQLYIEILVRKFQRYIYLPKYILDDQLKKIFQFLFINYTFQPPNHKKIFWFFCGMYKSK